MEAPPAVRLAGVRKTFPGVVANDDVTLSARSGHVHALVGENGAGKSTLMKILYGLLQPDAGTIELDGVGVHLRSPRDAIAHGIGMVHQHFMLADNLTVAENIVLGQPGPLALTAARARIIELGRAYGLTVDPDALVADLGVGQRQRVEILKVLYRGAKIVILDEPTAVLVPQEVSELFENLRELRSEGLTVLFISHKLDEVLQVADEITVLRRGSTVATLAASQTSSGELARLMVGHELPPPPPARPPLPPDALVVLSLHGVRTAEEGVHLDGVDLELRRGEILGIAGVEGNGQSELIEVLLGLTQPIGEIVHAPGLGVIPEDRQREALLLTEPLWANRILGHHRRAPFARAGLINAGYAKSDTERVIREYQISAPSASVPVFALSGGNQQKLVVARELEANPHVLIAAHPTRGVDIGAQGAIWERLRAARDAGAGILLISADLSELFALSDRIAVMLRGRIVATRDPRRTTPAQLGEYMTGAAT